MSKKTFSTKETDMLKAVIEFTQKLGLTKSYDALLEESGFSPNDIPTKNVLESKWNTILVYTKKVHDLEAQMKNMKEEIEHAKVNGTNYVSKKEGDMSMVSFTV
jgi:hypothetical protein